MRQLLNQWAHPEFASIAGFQQNLETSRYSQGGISTDDWSQATLPSWIDSIVEGDTTPESRARTGAKSSCSGIKGNTNTPSDALGFCHRTDAIRRVQVETSLSSVLG
jgi:hypothetical protein